MKLPECLHGVVSAAGRCLACGALVYALLTNSIFEIADHVGESIVDVMQITPVAMVGGATTGSVAARSFIDAGPLGFTQNAITDNDPLLEQWTKWDGKVNLDRLMGQGEPGRALPPAEQRRGGRAP